MGVHTVSSPSTGGAARPDRQVVLVFVPTENLRRVCVVPLELMTGVLLLAALAVRSRLAGWSSADDEQRQPTDSRVSNQQSERGSDPFQQGSDADPPVPGDANQQRRDGSTPPQQDRAATDSCAEDMPESGSSGTARCEEQDHGDATLREAKGSEKKQPIQEHVKSHADFHTDGETNEEEMSHEYGPFWPCSVHPPNQALRFCDLNEEEQGKIMEADLDAYRKAWRPGDQKHILWNPDPSVPDGGQGQEAFHDENYEFFWWTPTAYRATMDKYVFYPGNITKYPVHGPVYCSVCDRHVWESIPQRVERLKRTKQLVPELPAYRQSSYITEHSQANFIPSEFAEEGAPAQAHRLPQHANLPILSAVPTWEMDSFHGSSDVHEMTLHSGQDCNLRSPGRNAHEVIPTYQYVQTSVNPHEAATPWAPLPGTNQFCPQFVDDPFSHPERCTAPVGDDGLMDSNADKAKEADPTRYIKHQQLTYARTDHQAAPTLSGCELSEQEAAGDVTAGLERLTIAEVRPSSEDWKIEEADEGRSQDVDCLERKLLELLENPTNMEITNNKSDHKGSHSGCTNGATMLLPPNGRGSPSFEEKCPEAVEHETEHMPPKQSEVGRRKEVDSLTEQTQGKQNESVIGGPGVRDVMQEHVEATTEECPASKLTREDNREDLRDKRRIRGAHRPDPLKKDSVLESKPGPSGRCGCTCKTCNGCTGRSKPGSPESVKFERKLQHCPIVGAALCLASQCSKDLRSKKTIESGAHHGKTRSAGGFPLISSSESITNKSESTNGHKSCSSDAKDHFIDVSFGDYEPVRVYKQTQTQVALPIRPFYEPRDRFPTPGIDTVLGDGCMDRLVASGLNMDDFIITEGSGPRAKTMLLWPGPPTKPCVDLVGQRSHLTNYRVPSLPKTFPELRCTSLDQQKCNPKSSQVPEASKRPSKSESLMDDVEVYERKSSEPSCVDHGVDATGDTGRLIQSEILRPPEESETVVPPTSMSSRPKKDDESFSPCSSEDDRKTQIETKRRFRLMVNKIRSEKEASSPDPSSPFSTSESGSPSSDEGKQEKDAHDLRSQEDLPVPITDISTEIDNCTVIQGTSCVVTGQMPVSVGVGTCDQHVANLEARSVEDQLHSQATRMEIRRHLREVQRARRTVQYLRLVRRSYFHAAKAVRVRKLAQQLSSRRRQGKNGTRRLVALGGNCLEAVDTIEDATVSTKGGNFTQELVSALSPPPQVSGLSNLTGDTTGDPLTHRAEVAVNNGNIIDVYNAVRRIAADSGAREVEVELRPKNSPLPAGHKLDRTETNGELRATVQIDVSPQTEKSVRCDIAEAANSMDVPPSPHKKADGLWNGRLPGDSAELSNSSGELAAQGDAKVKVDLVDETQQVTGASSSRTTVPGGLSSEDVREEVDFAREFEDSELGKLIALGAELEELEQEASTRSTTSPMTEAVDPENAGHGVCGGHTASDGPGSFPSVSMRTLRRRSPPWDNRPLDALMWDPSWLQSPPLSPRRRLWSIFDHLPGGLASSQSRHALPWELLPGAAEDTPVGEDQPAGGLTLGAAVHPSVLHADRTSDDPAQLLGLKPNVLIRSAHLQPEDNLLAHGDPARPWVRCHAKREVKTLADLIASRQPRPGLAANPNISYRPPVAHCSQASFTT